LSTKQTLRVETTVEHMLSLSPSMAHGKLLLGTAGSQQALQAG